MASTATCSGPGVHACVCECLCACECVCSRARARSEGECTREARHVLCAARKNTRTPVTFTAVTPVGFTSVTPVPFRSVKTSLRHLGKGGSQGPCSSLDAITMLSHRPPAVYACMYVCMQTILSMNVCQAFLLCSMYVCMRILIERVCACVCMYVFM